MSTIQYLTAIKGGKLASTMARGHLSGRVVHAVPGTQIHGFWGTPALCNAKPSTKGYGWHDVAATVTCKKCLQKIGQANLIANQIQTLQQKLASLESLAIEYRSNLGEPGIEPDYWASFQIDLHERFKAVAEARDGLARVLKAKDKGVSSAASEL